MNILIKTIPAPNDLYFAFHKMPDVSSSSMIVIACDPTLVPMDLEDFEDDFEEDEEYSDCVII